MAKRKQAQHSRGGRQREQLNDGLKGQAKGAQGWREINHPSGTSIPAKAPRGEPAGRAGAAAKGIRGSPPKSRRGKKKPPEQPPPTWDSAMIDAVRGWPWPVKQALLALFLLAFMAFIAVCLLTRNQADTPLATLGAALAGLFGWGAYLLVFGLAAFALASLVEAALRTSFIRRTLLIELAALSCLLIAEVRLLVGPGSGALFGELLIQPVKGFPPTTQQTIILGAMGIVLLLIFRISFSQFWGVVRWFWGVVRWFWSVVCWFFSGVLLLVSKLGRALAFLAHLLGALWRRRRDDNSDFSEWEEEEESNLSRSMWAEEEDGEAGNVPFSESISALPILPPLPMKPVPAPSPAPSASPMPAPPPQTPPQRKSDTGSFSAVLAAPQPRYELPAITLLNPVAEQRLLRQDELIERLARKVEHTLRSFRIDAEVRRSDISIGPTIIRIGIRPIERIKRDYRGKVILDEDGEPVIARTRVSRIMALQNDLALDLEAQSIRMEAPVPGRPYVGVEIPNKQSRLVTLRELLASKEHEESRRASKLTIALGRDVAGRPRVGDLARFPHLLIAGATGAGKSVCLNSIIACLLMQATPEDVRFLMIDPKRVELINFNGIPHLLAPVVTEVERVIGILKRALSEMERRYKLFARLEVRNLDAYRRLCAQRPTLEKLPNIVIIIDELADLMMAAPDEVEHLVCRLAQMARATGIHLVIATQRPSVDVITGLIKANIPTRISFMVSSVVDSRTILDMGGAERLLGRGDMLYMPADAGKPERIQCTFLADEELERVVAHWRHAPQMPSAPEHPWESQEEDDSQDIPPAQPEDDLLPQAIQIVREAGKASISLLQRRLSIGYSRAARLIDLLEEHGVISAHDPGTSRARDVLPAVLPSEPGTPPRPPMKGEPGASLFLPDEPASNSASTSKDMALSDTIVSGASHGQVMPGSPDSRARPLLLPDFSLPPYPASQTRHAHFWHTTCWKA
jgi:hypothetical protein